MKIYIGTSTNQGGTSIADNTTSNQPTTAETITHYVEYYTTKRSSELYNLLSDVTAHKDKQSSVNEDVVELTNIIKTLSTLPSFAELLDDIYDTGLELTSEQQVDTWKSYLGILESLVDEYDSAFSEEADLMEDIKERSRFYCNLYNTLVSLDSLDSLER